MGKKIWIWNHYATNMYIDQAGRHYSFAENLLKEGYSPTIFCASTNHFSKQNIDTKGNKYITDTVNDIPFVFVKSPKYTGNGIKRLLNMVTFFINLFPVAKKYAKINNKPDVIFASSVHPLTLVAGIMVAKKFGVPCICEIRDLWPESIIAYGLLKRNSFIAKILFKGEKWIYQKADYIIMTWEGGKDYIIDQGWEKFVDLSKIKHISNGVDLDMFDRNSNEYCLNDSDLESNNYKNIVYAGSIRKVNNIGMLLDVAKIIQNKGYNQIRFLIYGLGNELEMLKKRCKDEGINNVLFKGRVEKKYIPYILKRAYVNILHNTSTTLNKYGQSQNKLFEYLAAGRCIVQTYSTGYNIIKKYNCGLTTKKQNAEEIAKVVIEACMNEEMNKLMGQNARLAAFEFDYKVLTSKLISIIDDI